MPSIHGGLDDETYELFEEYLLGDRRFENQSEALEWCVVYTLVNHYGVSP